MSDTSIYSHYTYEIYDPVLDMSYIGSRSCKGIPEEDDYWGSLENKEWKDQWEEITARSTKRILNTFPTREDALADEIYLHKFHDVARNPKFFNGARQTSTGFSRSGATVTIETRRKLSESNKGKRPSNLTIKKLSESHKGQVPWNKGKETSEETKRKMSLSHKGKTGTMLGKKHSEETKNKMREDRKGRSGTMNGRKHSEEARRKMSEKAKIRHENKLRLQNNQGS